MKKRFTQKWEIVALVIISIVIIIIGFALINNFTFLQSESPTETYTDPETGNESTYDPTYFTEEEIEAIRAKYDDEEGHLEGHQRFLEDEEANPEP